MEDHLIEKKVLITGATGFVGRNLLKLIATTGWDMIPLIRRKTGLSNEIILDFCDSSFSQSVAKLPTVEAVIHLGAKVSFDANKEELFIPNVLSTAELVAWAKRIKAYFLFVSTAIVCGEKNLHITSKSSPNPDTAYSYSKWIAEEIIRMSGVKHSILRIGGVFGKDGPYHLSLNKTIDNALKGTVPIQYGDGRLKRNYIYVKDLANVIVYCLENKIEGTHFVSGSAVNTVSEMLKVICDVLLGGRKPEYREGNNGQDQIVEHSICLPKGFLFEEAIKDIKDS